MPPKFANKNKKRKPRARKTETPKSCRFTKDETFEVDYRDIGVIGRYTSSQGKINGRKRSGCSAFYQRQMNVAIKRARYLALLPYVGE